MSDSKKFNDLINKGHKDVHFDEPVLASQLFDKLGKEKYKDLSFFDTASEFIKDFGDKLDSEFNEKYWISHRNECISCLVSGKGKSHSTEEKESIIEHLKKNISYESTEQINEFKNLNEKYIEKYRKSLNQLKSKYEKWKGKNLLYALQLIGVIENISLMDQHFHDVESIRGVGYLISPSHIHYFSNTEQTIFIYLGVSDLYGSTIRRLLEKHRPKTKEIYLFTLETNLPFYEIADFKFCGVKLVTTCYIKNQYYAKNENVMTIEKLLKLCKEKQNYGDNCKFSREEKKFLYDSLKYKINYFHECKRLKDFFWQQLEKLNESEYQSFKSLEEIINGNWQ